MKDVQKAIAALNKLMIAKIKSTCNLRSKLNTRKRDWLLIYQQEELTRIMRDNGSFIVFPPFGSDKSDDIYVYAENNLDVERTLRSLNYLVSRSTSMLFQVVIYLNSSHIQWVDLFTRLSQSSGTEILFQSDNNQLDITGTKKQVLSIVELLSKHSIIQDHHLSSVFSIELASDQRDFISGKKNGKINKIMKSCEAHIHFKEYNEFNFLIHIQSDDFLKAKKGLDSLQKELPAEISFFVPEICHRRIIGVGGKNIQRVMKQFGVYVKFSSNEEMASSVGYFDVDHNVIARTPEKNIKSLDKLKASIMEFISFQKDRDYISKQEYVPSFAHRKLLHLHGKFLREKGKLYNSKIVWPERNGTDHVLVVGPESHIEEMQLRIRNLLPQSAEVQISSSSALECLLASDRMEELINNIYSTTSIHLILPQPMGPRKNGQHHQSSLLSTSMEPLVRIIDCDTFSFFNNHTSTFKLCYDDNSKHKLDEAKDILNTFISHNSSLSKELSDIPYDDLLTLVDAHHISPSVMHRIDFPESCKDI
ncbi:hypothetical protein BDB01DRAFT_841410 [Pilobolus umbonatus]|nr:hypothetical protein BDB01DRAFT_841410 [Pilobolus umbonatus]